MPKPPQRIIQGHSLARVATVRGWVRPSAYHVRTLIEGPAEESYGLYVARLAGLSERVLNRASSIMERLQESGKVFHDALPGSMPEANPSLEPPLEFHDDEGGHSRFERFLEESPEYPFRAAQSFALRF